MKYHRLRASTPHITKQHPWIVLCLNSVGHQEHFLNIILDTRNTFSTSFWTPRTLFQHRWTPGTLSVQLKAWRVWNLQPKSFHLKIYFLSFFHCIEARFRLGVGLRYGTQWEVTCYLLMSMTIRGRCGWCWCWCGLGSRLYLGQKQSIGLQI